MTLEILQQEMIKAMKEGRKLEKETISGLIAQIKTAAINEGCRDNITEEFVNKQILKAKKQAQESIEGAVAAERTQAIAHYTTQYCIIDSFAPQLITDEAEITSILSSYDGDRNKGAIMKWLKANYGGKMDMKIAAQVASKML